jgi:hypothetical protein
VCFVDGLGPPGDARSYLIGISPLRPLAAGPRSNETRTMGLMSGYNWSRAAIFFSANPQRHIPKVGIVVEISPSLRACACFPRGKVPISAHINTEGSDGACRGRFTRANQRQCFPPTFGC